MSFGWVSLRNDQSVEAYRADMLVGLRIHINRLVAIVKNEIAKSILLDWKAAVRM
jgi:hypothetical protein